VNGSTRPCSVCERGTLEFNERYRLPGAGGHVVAIPAWICDACGLRSPARADQQPEQLRQAAKVLRARSNRTLMKSRTVRTRATRVLESSAARKRKRGA
jgi:C4-type Zn-finger protein